ncbi:hypothetical protein ADIARSV_0982 [Arcticibacter svalbardensis MN12-7]|uniref:Uncharacterized protein n=1 Tax=Arcticibacter svalbardensis MN12-7 TaxID=1150600 RepID=R9GWD8_9SPHI|nr:hypothetical protein ADIARSV_0982 [Arcticibacter svalbardensis MN12-7]
MNYMPVESAAAESITAVVSDNIVVSVVAESTDVESVPFSTFVELHADADKVIANAMKPNFTRFFILVIIINLNNLQINT